MCMGKGKSSSYNSNQTNGALQTLRGWHARCAHLNILRIFIKNSSFKALHAMQVKAPHSYASLRGLFDGWNDIDGTLLPLPYQTLDRNSKNHRVYPPNAAWYTVTRTPVFTQDYPEPQDWNDMDCKKNLADHKRILMSKCDAGGITEEWQRKLIMAIAMLVRVFHCVLSVRLHTHHMIVNMVLLMPFAFP